MKDIDRIESVGCLLLPNESKIPTVIGFLVDYWEIEDSSNHLRDSICVKFL